MEQSDFLNAIFGSCDRGEIEVRYLPSRKQEFIPLNKLENLENIQPTDRQDIYFGVATREGKGGKKAHIAQIPALWVDLDFKNGSRPQPHEILANFPNRPSIIVNSGHGYHFYWLLKEPEDKSNIIEIENINKRIASVLKGDPASTDASRILRIPGTINYKNRLLRAVKLLEINPSLTYELDSFRDYLPALPVQAIDNKPAIQAQANWQDGLLNGVGEGQRNTAATQLVGRMVGKGLSQEEVLLFVSAWNNKNSPPLPEKEIESVVQSIWKSHRQKNPAAQNDPLPEIDLSRCLETWNDIRSMEIKVEYLVDRLIPKNAITILFGKGGIGKTWLLLQIAAHVSKGTPLFELESKKNPIVYIDYENPLSVLNARIQKFDEIEQVSFWRANNPNQKAPKLDTKEWEYFKQLPAESVLIFDSLRSSHGGDENASDATSRVMERLKTLRDMGFTIIVLHHTPKNSDRVAKGSSAIVDLADHILGLNLVKRSKDGQEEIIEDDQIGGDAIYRLGTRDKTRFEPYQIYLTFNPDLGFETAPGPNEGTLSMMKDILEKDGQIQKTEFARKCHDELGIPEKKARALIKAGDGRYWRLSKGDRNSKLVQPFLNGDQETEKAEGNIG